MSKIFSSKLPLPALNIRGDWEPHTKYAYRDVVRHDDALWVALDDCTDRVPGEDAVWQLIYRGTGDAEDVLYQHPDLDGVQNVKEALDRVVEGIPYQNPLYPEVDTLQEAMDKVIQQANPIALDVRVNPFTRDADGFPISGITYPDGILFEEGTRLGELTFRVETDRPLDRLTVSSDYFPEDIEAIIDPDTGLVTIGSMEDPINIEYDTLLRFTAISGGETAEYEYEVNFGQRRYFGVSTSTDVDAALLIDLSSDFMRGREQSRTFDCTGGQYFYIAYPEQYGEASFKVNSMPFSAIVQSSIEIYGVPYLVYRPMYKQRGSYIPVEVL